MKKLIYASTVILIICTVVAMPSYDKLEKMVWRAFSKPIVVIDPGHGGIDGGAQAPDGTMEKNINLKISMLLKEKLEKNGVAVILTRNSDKGLYDKNSKGAIRSLKTEDMHKRKAIIDEAEADLVVSIHLNSFREDRSVKGAQAFYPAWGDDKIVKQSKAAAKIAQKNFNRNLNKEKPRTALEKDDVFLLKDATCPIIILECGFLSNDEELTLLKDESYQVKIANSIKTSVSSYLMEYGNNNQKNNDKI